MASWQNGKLSKRVLMKWQADKIASCQNSMLRKWQVDEMAS